MSPEDSNKQLSLNIPKCFIMRAFAWSFLYLPTFVLYLQEHKISLREVFLLKACLCITNLLLEIPSGYFADVFGRRLSILLGSATLLLAMFVYGVGSSFFDFILAEICLGVGWSFISGADAALLYDTLSSLGKSGKYLKTEGKMFSTSSFSEAFGGLLGGYLAAQSLVAPFVAQGICYVLFFITALSLTEPPRAKKFDRDKRFLEFRKALHFIGVENKTARALIFYNAAVGSATFVIVWFSQPYMKEVGVPLAYFGVIWFLLHIWLGVVSFTSARITEILSLKVTLCLLPVLIFLAYGILSFSESLWGLGALFLLYFVRGVRMPLTRTLLQEQTTADIRATTISVGQFAGSLLFVAVGPFLGWASDAYSLSVAFMLTGAIYLVLGVFSTRLLLKKL